MILKETERKTIPEQFRDRLSVKTLLQGASYWFFLLVYMEVLLHWRVFGDFTGKFLYTVGFSAVIAVVLTAVVSLLPNRAGFWTALLVTVGAALLYGSQLVYHAIFGTLYSAGLIRQGGAAMTSFWRETLSTVWNNLPAILLLVLPPVVLCLLVKFREMRFSPMNWLWRGVAVAAAVLVQVVLLLCLQLGGTAFFTDHYFYYSGDATTDQVAERFGLLTAFRLELSGNGRSEGGGYDMPVTMEPAPTETEEPQNEQASTDATQETEPEIHYNVLPFDFEALNGMTEDETIRALNDYCAQLTGTTQNAYTGMLADYNLVVLCAESFATGAIHPEVTPTLYRLANEGIIFNNFYNSFPNTTTDGEYALCMGLYPDASRGKSVSSLYASRGSYLPFTLGNIFREQAGVQAYGYHNYESGYYGREESHPNMGYQMKFAGDGMTFTYVWPASDLEMMEQSVDDYIGQEQFHAYYMTFSGHYQYHPKLNMIANQNWAEVEHLEYSEKSRAYLSCNVELDKALEYLMERLEEEGVADRTAIVLVGDHFPYGLTNEEYSELVGYEIDGFSKFKSTLIFWVGGLEENIVVDEYCCNVDILPTILNLWGFSYDSRMLAGTDVFSDGEHMAVLVDKSFLTDKVWFNASTGEIRYLVDEEEVPPDYMEYMNWLVKSRFSLSKDILNTAYYNFVFEKGDAVIDRQSWWK